MNNNSNLENRFDNPIQVIAFDRNLKLIAIFASYNAVQKTTGRKHQIIYKACHGVIIAVNGIYWREVPPNKEVEPEDIGTLTLLEFDKMMNVNRRIYATRNMKRDEIILESQYEERFNILINKRNKKCKRK